MWESTGKQKQSPRVAVRALEEVPWALLSSCGSKQGSCLQTVFGLWSSLYLFCPLSCDLILVLGVLHSFCLHCFGLLASWTLSYLWCFYTLLLFKEEPPIWGLWGFSGKTKLWCHPAPCTNLWGHMTSAISTNQQGCPLGRQQVLWQLWKLFLSIFIFNS